MSEVDISPALDAIVAIADAHARHNGTSANFRYSEFVHSSLTEYSGAFARIFDALKKAGVTHIDALLYCKNKRQDKKMRKVVEKADFNPELHNIAFLPFWRNNAQACIDRAKNSGFVFVHANDMIDIYPQENTSMSAKCYANGHKLLKEIVYWMLREKGIVSVLVDDARGTTEYSTDRADHSIWPYSRSEYMEKLERILNMTGREGVVLGKEECIAGQSVPVILVAAPQPYLQRARQAYYQALTSTMSRKT